MKEAGVANGVLTNPHAAFFTSVVKAQAAAVNSICDG